MAYADRELVAAIRTELAAIDPGRACDREAEVIGLGSPAATSEPAVARLALRLGLPAPPVSHRRVAAAGVSGGLASGGFDWEARPEHCRMAYLRGLFLAAGSLSISGPRTHLEFVVEAGDAPSLARRLGDAGLPASWRVRRGRGVVTWKSAETVALFLRRAGLQASLLEFEARRVGRAVRSDLNRVVNAESANLERAVAAAGRQLEAIEVLETDGRLATQPYTVRLVADGRRETPEATLSELAERLGVGRSVVQRALERIEWLALHDEPPRRRQRLSSDGGSRPLA